jgi:hypothetical protein
MMPNAEWERRLVSAFISWFDESGAKKEESWQAIKEAEGTLRAIGYNSHVIDLMMAGAAWEALKKIQNSRGCEGQNDRVS